MSTNNPWIKQTRYFCQVCSSWMDNNPRAIRVHESGKKHVDNAEKQRIATRDEHKKQAKEKERMDQIMAEIERKAATKYAEDVGQPAVISRAGSTPNYVTERRESAAPKPFLTQSSHVPVPVGSGCYCGADGVYYYYDATTQQYSVVDTQWAQTQIATYGPLQFASPSTAASADMDITAVAAEAHARNLPDIVAVTTHPSSSLLSALPATRAPVTAALGLALPNIGKARLDMRPPPGVKRKAMDSNGDAASTLDTDVAVPPRTSSTVLCPAITSDGSLPAAIAESDVAPTADVVGEWEDVVEKPEELVTREDRSISRTNFGGSSLVMGSKTHIAADVQAPTIVNNSEDDSEEEFVFRKKKKVFDQ